MSTDESMTVMELVAEVGATNAAVVETAKACTAEQWETVVPGEEWPVGVIFHHIAVIYPLVADWVQKVANGEALPPVTYDAVHAMNHQHATDNAGASQADTVALLEANGADAQAKIGQLEDEDLAKEADLALTGGKINPQQLVEMFMIGHDNGHLKNIKDTLGM